MCRDSQEEASGGNHAPASPDSNTLKVQEVPPEQERGSTTVFLDEIFAGIGVT